MASVKDLRVRIASVKSTQKITKAMQMVAAAKLRRAQTAAESARPYATKMAEVIANHRRRNVGRRGAAAAGRQRQGSEASDRRCDLRSWPRRRLQFGHRARRAGTDRQSGRPGQRGEDHHHRPQGARPVASTACATPRAELRARREIGDNGAGAPDGREDHRHVRDRRDRRRVAGVEPLQVGRYANADDTPDHSRHGRKERRPGASRSTITSRTKTTILETLLPQNIGVQILSALLENQAGFYAAQMTAMDNATRNAGDLINALTVQMNRTRQAQITKELIEIISGAAAV